MKSILGFLGIMVILQGTVSAQSTNVIMGTVSVPTNTTVVATTTATTTATGTLPMAVIATATSTCSEYLNTYHKFGDMGKDVVTLQKFLNKYNGAKLNEKGYFGPVTMQEVKNFQFAYGIKTTGAQYQKTTKAINDIVCGKLAVKERTVHMAVAHTEAPVVKNIYPNSPAPTKAMNKPAVSNVKVNDVKGTATTTTISTTTSTGTGVFANFQSDFQEVKENYKAYLLVFLLVLALFWFLRKAATE